MTDFAASKERFFAKLQAYVEQKLEDAAGEDGMITAEEVNRLSQLFAVMFNRMFDAYIDRAGSVDPALVEAQRQEFEPWRELLRKTIMDRVRPH